MVPDSIYPIRKKELLPAIIEMLHIQRLMFSLTQQRPILVFEYTNMFFIYT